MTTTTITSINKIRSFERYPDGYYFGSGSPPGSSSMRHKRNKSEFRTRYACVNEIAWTDYRIKKIGRCGCLFYTFTTDQPDSLSFCFGIDTQTSELTDFAGGRKSHESILDCAIRESNEETRYAFGQLSQDDIQGLNCLYNDQMFVILVPVKGENDDIREISLNNYNDTNIDMMDKKGNLLSQYAETSGLEWISYNDMRNNMHRMYDKVRNFLRNSDIWNENLPNILLS